jgi:hypothetical protein
MLTEIKSFPTNAIALELVEPFTEADAELIRQLFDAKLNAGYQHVNLLIKVKDLSVMAHMSWKAFIKGELWGFRHFGKIGRCAVVAHSTAIKSIVNVESKILGLTNPAFEEKYFDIAELAEAITFITTD